MKDANKFALETFEDGGVLLDLESGLLFRLNRTATDIWTRALASTDPTAIASDLSLVYDMPVEKLQHDVAATLSLPDDHGSTLTDSGSTAELTYLSTANGYLFSMNGLPAVEVDVASGSIRLMPGIPAREYGVCLRAIAPKLVARTGPSVLHAAAVVGPNRRVTAFLGMNGAGKTTTARTFAANGFELICEDKLVTQVKGDRVEAVIDAERKINQWIRETRQRLEAHPDRSCDATSLAGCGEGPSVPIGEVFLIDSQRRLGSSIALHRLPPSQAASEIFQHAFYGSAHPLDWRQQLAAIAIVARTAGAVVATLPDGLEQLADAVRSYTEMTAS